MSSHPEIAQLSDFIDGELSELDRSRLESHLTGCADCRTTLVALRATLSDLASLGEDAPSEEDRWAVRSALAKERKLGGRARRYGWAAGGIAAAVAGILAFALLGHGAPKNAATGVAPDGARLAAAAPESLDRSGANDLVKRFALRLSGGAEISGEDSSRSRAEALSAESPKDSAPQAAPVPDRPLSACVKQLKDDEHRDDPGQTGVSSFEGTPAYLIFFELPRAKPDRVELWVVSRASCDVLYFAQAKIRS